MNDRLTPERENEIRRALTSKTKWRGGTWWADDATDLLAELDACRRDLAEEQARTSRLTETLADLVSPRRLQSRYTMREAIRLLLKECGAGTEQPA